MDEKNTPKIGHEAHAVPFDLFDVWFNEAKNKEKPYPDAMTLATADANGRPSARIVLLKGFDERGFVFYTNYESRKGDQLAENSFAALCFHWKALEKCVRIEGAVTRVDGAESDEYFASRPRGSQLGAWASIQSRPMGGRFDLEKRVAEFTARFGLGKVPRPDHWGGFRLIPDRIEFWSEGKFRLHDRQLYTRDADDKGWNLQKLFP
ncbi:MAG: pyridoxamine 5'-phosphate oxidase [Thalassospira sp.]|uniref:pyridoxamine 5'-phosphate oxidase n=1 Tax=Thalassospira sp. TaxID=1912094 RepID=UPI000C4B1D97|nr:pyridoxamine 5'-phosphate oxidase [Thalassospira sp.]MAZ34446.1 pyridoxamine 5'-phosphate oxidase [Thalassospira sp.]